MTDDDGLVRIAGFRLRRQAEMAGGLLDNQGIPHAIQSEEGPYGPMPSGSSLVVRAEHADQARQLLQDVGVLDADDGDDG